VTDKNTFMTEENGPNRREFLCLAGAAASIYAIPALAKEEEEEGPAGPPIPCAVLGTGIHGRKMLSFLSQIAEAKVVACCDVYAPYLSRTIKKKAPGAAGFSDYKKMLAEKPEIEVVFIATPTHLHKEVAIAALEAGKHVYCEAPMASTIEDAKAIAAAAKASDKSFAVGLQLRANPHFDHALGFLKVRAIGELVADGGYKHINSSWKRAVSDPAFAKAMNWRTDDAVTMGLIGEAGVHSFDNTLRAVKQLPSAVTTFGSIIKWDDGRKTPDTVQCVFEFPSGFQSRFEATSTNSYNSSYNVLHGTHGSILLTDKRCWMFQEADAPSLGWEVYALREKVGWEDGIVLVAGASKLAERDLKPGDFAAQELANAKDSVYSSLESFLKSIHKKKKPACGYKEGYRSVVMAVKAMESYSKGEKIKLEKGLFKI
jgi:predicted dehydrogenase